MDSIPFYPTYILYDPRDVVAVVCVHLSLAPIYLMVFYTSWFLVTREIQPVITVGGHLFGEVLNKVIKHWIKQPRPEFHKSFGAGSYGLTYGMPSAHSQFAGFFASYFFCIAYFQAPLPRWQRHVAGACFAASAVGVPFSRVYLQYHTTPQAVVGVAVGVVSGVFYYLASSLARDVGLVDWVLSWPAVAYFSVKDSYYHSYRSFAQERQQVEAEKRQRAEGRQRAERK